MYQLKIFNIINILPPSETLLRLLSLDLLDNVAKRLYFHSTTILLLDFFNKDQTSLITTRLYSTHSTRWPNGSIVSSIFCRVKIRAKNRVVWPGPKVPFRSTFYHRFLLPNPKFLRLVCELPLYHLKSRHTPLRFVIPPVRFVPVVNVMQLRRLSLRSYSLYIKDQLFKSIVLYSLLSFARNLSSTST